MRRTMTLFGILVIGLCAVSVAQRALAFPAYARASKAACAACHMNVAGGPGLTDLGTKYKADPTTAVPTGVKGADYVGSNKCMQCHTAITSPKFNFDEYKKLGVHVVVAAVPAPAK